MQKLDLIDGPVEFAGVAEVRPGHDGGVLFSRLPRRDRHLFAPMMAHMVRVPSGVRARFRTDAAAVRVVALPTVMRPAGDETPAAPVDLVVDGATIATAATTAGSHVLLDPREPANTRIEDRGPAVYEFALPGAMAEVELWFPNDATFSLDAIEVSDGAAVEAPTPDERPRWVHYGSSISQCSEADQPTGIWPAVAARLGGFHLTNLGFGGQCHLDHYVANHIAELPADRISMKVGINIAGSGTMTQRVFMPAVHAFLDLVRAGHPTTPVIVASPIWCEHFEDRPGPGANVDGVFGPGPDNPFEDPLTLTWIRECLAEVVAVRTDAGDPHLTYVDGLALFSAADADDLPDNLHPNGTGYRRMGERWHALVDG